MRRLLYLLLIMVFAVVVAGCSVNGTAKSEDELREEIRAELEAEAKLKEEIRAELEAAKEKEQANEQANQQNDVKSQDASQSQGVVDIKDLKVGSTFAGGTIQKISFNANQYDANLDLTLAGEFTLAGTLEYSEFDQGVIFTVDESKFPTEIKLSDEFRTINPFAWPMGFRPQNILVQQLGEVTYNKLKNEPGSTIPMVVRAKDLQFSCIIPGQAGGNWELIEIISQ